ncbi:MAG: hypothetical protein MZV70_70490 [Desulfobacterales bacterium]|nr:hypothetical protein [Desulfobacterales bacterium]
MDRPTDHYYHVVFRAEGLEGETQDFKMPAWTPGYYRIMDYAKFVKDFRAEDGAGPPARLGEDGQEHLARPHRKGRVRRRRATTSTPSPASSPTATLGDDGGFITPTGVFMHVAGRLNDPVTLTVVPHAGWKRVSTGPRSGRRAPHTFTRSRLRHALRLPHPRRQPGDPDVRGRGPPPYRGRLRPRLLRPGEIHGRPREDRRGGGRAHGRAPLPPLHIPHHRPRRRRARAPELDGRHAQPGLARRRARLPGLAELHRPRVLPPLQRQVHPAGRPRPLRLRPRELHEHALVLRGRDGLLRVPAAQPGRADDPGGGPRAARLDHRRLRERPRAAPSIGDPLELRHLDRLLRPQRARGQHDHLLLRHRLRAGAPARPQDPRGLEGTLVARRRHADALPDLLQGEEARLHRPGVPRRLRDARPASRSARSSTSTPRPIEPWDYAKYLGYAGLSIDLEPKPAAGPWFGASTQDQGGNAVVSAIEPDSPASLGRPLSPGRDPGGRRDARHPAVARRDAQRPQARRTGSRSSTRGAARSARRRSRWAGSPSRPTASGLSRTPTPAQKALIDALLKRP